MNTIDTSSMNI